VHDVFTGTIKKFYKLSVSSFAFFAVIYVVIMPVCYVKSFNTFLIHLQCAWQWWIWCTCGPK